MTIELAWAAGFFDGEGCFSLRDGYLSADIGQVDDEVLRRFHAAVEGRGVINGPYARSNPDWTPIWNFASSGNDAQEIGELLRPFLCSIKVARLDELLETCKIPHRRGYCRQDIHKMEGDNVTPDGRCRECRKASHRASWNRRHLRHVNGRVAP